MAASAIAVIIGAFVAWAGSQGSITAMGAPVFALIVAFAFLVQWIVFVPSYAMKTERYYDLTGSFTYISAISLAVALSGVPDARTILLLVLVLLWAGRLGTYLFRRVRRAGKDERFDEIKRSFPRFLRAWTVQGLWVSLTLAAALAAITGTENRQSLDALTLIGLAVWITGFSIESIADLQKSRFRADPANKGGFIHTGLWAWSRHPNYFGEIVIWVGVALIALPTLSGWRLVALISPVFVAFLLTRVSGVPILEKQAEGLWGGQEAYEEYKRRTPVLVPWIGHRG